MDARGPAHETVLSPGTKISHYEIKGIIGRGGMGIVYRALDLKLDREVALKCVLPDRSGDRGRRRRLQREARSASKLSHPNIVTVFNVLEVHGQPAFVMELIEGSSLRQEIDKHGALELEKLIRHAETLADALAYAHGKKVLHRDVNPNNILISVEGRALLTDFGLARELSGSELDPKATTISQLSAPGAVMGTPGYMSPDQLLGRTLDQRSDIFAFGAVLYEMCTGQPAFPVAQGIPVDSTLHDEPTAISRLNYAIPEELERIVKKALAKRPDERYQSAQEMAVDLRALRRRTESGATDAGEILRRRRPLRRGLTYAGVAAVLLGLLIAWQLLVLPRPVDEIPAAKPYQITSGLGLEGGPEISPDGTLVAYVSDQSGDKDLWISDVKSGQSLSLTRDPAIDRDPTWFPDGDSIAFVSDRSGNESVWRISRLGGTGVMLVPNANEPAISPDGQWIAFARGGAEGTWRIWVAPLADVSSAEQLTDSNAGLWNHGNPAWSPDGGLICYEDFEDLWLIPAHGGRPEKLTKGRNQAAWPAWSPTGRYVYFSRGNVAARALWRAKSDGSQLQRVTLGTGGEGEPSLSRDGARLAYATRNDDWRIVLLDRHTGERRLLPSLHGAHQPAIVGEPPRVLLLSLRGGRPTELWAVPIFAGRPADEPLLLTDVPGIGTFAISPDEQYIALHRKIDGQRDIWIMPAQGGVPVNVTAHPAADVHPAWSPEGQFLAFSSDRGGQANIWVLPMEGGKATGPARQLTQEESTDWFPAWSPDGSQLAYISNAEYGWDVWVVQADGSQNPRRVTRAWLVHDVQWSANPSVLLVSAQWVGRRMELREVNLVDGEVRELRTPVVFGDESAIGNFATSADGRYISYVEQRSGGDIWMIEALEGSF